MSKKVHAAVARSTFGSQKWRKLRGSEHFWMFGCHFGWQGILHLAKHEGVVAVYNHHYTTLPYTTLEYTTLHYPTLHYTTLITVHHLIVSIFPRGRFITLHSLQIQLPLRYTNYTAPQLQLHHATTTTATTAALRHTTSSSCG